MLTNTRKKSSFFFLKFYTPERYNGAEDEGVPTYAGGRFEVEKDEDVGEVISRFMSVCDEL